LTGIRALAAQKLGCVSDAAVGNGHLVDAVANCSINIVVGIPDVGASSDGGRNGGRIRKRFETSS